MFFSGLLNKPTEEFLTELKGIIFLNPQTNQWETDDQYVSGNVWEKFTIADAAAVSDWRILKTPNILFTHVVGTGKNRTRWSLLRWN